MGIEGIAIAVGVVLLIAIVVPALYRTRTTLVQAPEDERFASDLRMITEQSYSSHRENTEYRCTIYPMERVMETKKTPARNSRSREHTSKVRMAARARSRARAQMAARVALRQRFLAGGIALAAVAVIMWILVSTLSISLVIPVILSVILVAYVAGFVYLLRMWKMLDQEDQATLDEAQELLGSVKRARTRANKRARPETSSRSATLARPLAAERGEKPARADLDAPSISHERHGFALAARVKPGAASANSLQKASALKQAGQASQASQAGSVKKASTAKQTSAQTSAAKKLSVLKKISVPAYTLKPEETSLKSTEASLSKSAAQSVAVSPENSADSLQKSTHTNEGSKQTKDLPHHAKKKASYARGPVIIPPRDETEAATTAAAPSDEAATVSVPYRPQHVGERIGDEAPQPPYTEAEIASQASASEVSSDGAAYEDSDAESSAHDVRRDVLGVGAALDSIMDRRRA